MTRDEYFKRLQLISKPINDANEQYIERIRTANSMAWENAKQRQEQITQLKFINSMYDKWKQWGYDMSQDRPEEQTLITDNAGNVLTYGEIKSPVRFKKQMPISYLSIYPWNSSRNLNLHLFKSEGKLNYLDFFK